jgi:hypothetical protein
MRGDKEGIFPFKNIKLSRADIEWLLKKHEEEQASENLNNQSSLMARMDFFALCPFMYYDKSMKYIPAKI